MCSKARSDYIDALENPMYSQELVLQDICRVLKNTIFGQQHNIHKIKNQEDFRKHIPIRDYDGFSHWIEEEIKRKKGTLSSSTVKRWLKTSGSTGESKKIPYTTHWMQHYRVPALRVLFANYLEYEPNILSHMYATLDTQTVREKNTHFLNEVPYQGITNRNPPINKQDWMPPWYDSPWFIPDIPNDYDTRMYYRLRYFLGQDLRVILAINPSTLIALKYHLFKNISQLVEDIHNGTVNGKKILPPNPILAKQLLSLNNDEHFSFKKLWPNLSLISCWTSATAMMYLTQLEKLFPGVRILPFMTCGTEGIVTLPIDDHFVTGPLAINQGFYEFLPASVDIHAVVEKALPIETLLHKDLKLGEEYHLIFSQANGICRLAIGDIYKVIGFYKKVPRIEFRRRAGTYYSFTGEKITEVQMMMAIQKVYKKYSLNDSLFMSCPVFGDPPFYKVLVEVRANMNTESFSKKIAFDIDQELCLINNEYLSKRESHRLDNIKVNLTNIGSIERYQERKKLSNNAVQSKYKPFQLDDSVFMDILSEEAMPIC
jgi:hypothetical protein